MEAVFILDGNIMLEISICGYNKVLRVDQEAILFMDLDYGAIEHKK
jgi:hypothetical protein